MDEEGQDVPAGALGELVIAGPGVMRGYFGQPEPTARAFVRDDAGTSWYRTGDLVVDDGSGCFVFHGRRDLSILRPGGLREPRQDAALHLGTLPAGRYASGTGCRGRDLLRCVHPSTRSGRAARALLGTRAHVLKLRECYHRHATSVGAVTYRESRDGA